VADEHTITEPGEYPDVPAPEYHQDPVQTPSLSTSLAKVLTERTPKHAWLAHPRLNLEHEPDNKRVYDLGAAAHALLLGEDDQVDVIEAPDFRTKAAKEARDASLEAGRNPVLQHVYEQAQAMVRAARAQLQHHEEGYLALDPANACETTLVWQRQDGVWCRCRVDILPPAGGLIFDYKTTSASANPEDWTRKSLFDTGAYLSAASYPEAIKAVRGLEGWEMRYIVQETTPPYALSVVGLDPTAIAYAQAKWERAAATWRWCMQHDVWPGYVAKTAFAELPPWKEKELEDRKLRDELAREQTGKNLLELSMTMQATLEGTDQ
jgi:hypothetical protein